MYEQEGETHSKEVRFDKLPPQADMHAVEDGVNPDARGCNIQSGAVEPLQLVESRASLTGIQSGSSEPLFAPPKFSHTPEQTALPKQHHSNGIDGIFIVHLVRRALNGQSVLPSFMKLGLDLVLACLHVVACIQLP